MNKGLFIVIEGSDGSGKTTQIKLLEARLKAIGHDVEVFDFPRYNEPSSYFVRQYLSGTYGPASDVNPYTASLFYALDRYEASSQIKEVLEEGKIVLCNRFVGSNMAHQGSKFSNEGEQRGFFIWEDGLEYNLLGIPRPDTTIYLRVQAGLSENLIKKRAQANNKKLDEHEKSLKHLKKTITTYDLLCKLFPKDFIAVECTRDRKLLPITEINEKIWKLIKPILPPEPPNRAKASSLKLSSIERKKTTKEIPKASKRREKPTSTDIDKIFNLKNLSLLAANTLEAVAEFEINKSINLQETTFYKIQGLSKKLNKKYDESLSRISAIRLEMDRELSKSISVKNDLLLSTMPLASLVDISFDSTESAIKSLTEKLELYQLDELNFIAGQATIGAKKMWPNSFGDNPGRISKDDPAPIHQTLSAIATRLLTPNLGSSDSVVKLIKATPRNELDLLSEELYQYSSGSGSDLLMEMDLISYEEKSATMVDILSKDDQSLKERLSYRFDIISDFPTMLCLVEGLNKKNIRLQLPTPRYGFEVPQEIEDAGLSDLYDECFDISLDLFSAFQSEGKIVESSYCCLAGHKFRWQLNATAKDIMIISRSEEGTKTRLILQGLQEAIKEVHPLVGESFAIAAGPQKPKRNLPGEYRRRSVKK